MWSKLALALIALTATTCVDDGVDDTQGSLPTEQSPPPSDQTGAERFAPDMPNLQGVCGMLPADNSACAHACDPAALVQYVRPGECASFTCKLRDGSYYVTGACNNDH